ncbi:MAG: hypothetical protein KAT70_08075 [Thermoplasmata archaeon]|nr:hypothetical protein [Thermoplasmata archaeon]
MATKGDKFTNKDLEALRRHVVGGRSGPRAQSDYQEAVREIKKGPAHRRKWRKAMKAAAKGGQ